jgi:hypothetical protein
MNPQAATVGQRLGRKLNNALLVPAARRSPDPVAFTGGYLASIVGGAVAIVGPQTAAELLRITLGHLEKTPQLALPAGVRLQLAAAEQANDAELAGAPGAEAADDLHLGTVLQNSDAEQLECLRRVLAGLAAKAGIGDEDLVGMLNAEMQRIREGLPPAPAAWTR